MSSNNQSETTSSVNHHHDGGSEVVEYDVYKHSIVRYLGYTNELGEAFRSFLPKSIVNLTYVIASGYAVADALDKGYKQYQLQQQTNLSDSDKSSSSETTIKVNNTNNSINYKPIIHQTSDTLIWQFFASVTIPAFFVNRTCSLTSYVMNRPATITMMNKMFSNNQKKLALLHKLIPTASGLAIIPFLPLLLDHPIDLILDKTTRPLLNKYFKD